MIRQRTFGSFGGNLNGTHKFVDINSVSMIYGPAVVPINGKALITICNELYQDFVGLKPQ